MHDRASNSFVSSSPANNYTGNANGLEKTWKGIDESVGLEEIEFARMPVIDGREEVRFHL